MQPQLPPSRRRRGPARRSALLRSLLMPLVVLLLAAAAVLANGSGSSGRRRGVVRHAAAAVPRQPVVAWGETWEFEEDVLEPLRGLGTRVLDFVLRRQPPEEPHPLRMQRWTIHMRKFPFRRVIRHMQFYADGTCEVEEEIGGRKRRPPAASQSQQPQGGGGGSSSSSGKRRRKGMGKGKGTNGNGSGPLARGKWKYDKYGLNWELEEGGLRHFYHAELIWHSFGDRPKMHCGVIVRNRGPRSLLPPWLFRPVVGTFSGLGNGTDTYITTQETSDNRFQNY